MRELFKRLDEVHGQHIKEEAPLTQPELIEPKSEPQKIFSAMLLKHKTDYEKEHREMHGDDKKWDRLLPAWMYAFHDDTSVAVDGDLYDVMRDGQGEYGFGSVFYEELTKALKDAGYYLEAEGQGVYNFVKE